MDNYQLVKIELHSGDQPPYLLRASRAELVIVTDSGYRQWYIDLDGVADADWLRHYSAASDLRVHIEAHTAGGRHIRGVGYIHVNPEHHAAVIRGDDALFGI